MMIKIGNVVAINMSRVKSVSISTREKKEITKKGRWFYPDEYKTIECFDIITSYHDMDDHPCKHTLNCEALQFEEVAKIHGEIISQIKELEVESVSTALENAIRSS